MILTREAYAAVIDRHHAAEKARLLARFDVGAAQHEKPLDLLDGRDWTRERQEELDDAKAYEIFEREARYARDRITYCRPRSE